MRIDDEALFVPFFEEIYHLFLLFEYFCNRRYYVNNNNVTMTTINNEKYKMTIDKWELQFCLISIAQIEKF